MITTGNSKNANVILIPKKNNNKNKTKSDNKKLIPVESTETKTKICAGNIDLVIRWPLDTREDVPSESADDIQIQGNKPENNITS